MLPLTAGLAKTSLYFIHAAFEFNTMCERLSPDISASFVTINDQKWLRQLMAGHDILAVLDQVTSAYADAIASIRPSGPLCLAGHSSGGIFAMETARNLEKRGVTPDYVFLFDTYVHSWGRRALYDVFHNAGFVRKIQNTFTHYWNRGLVPRNTGRTSSESTDIEHIDVMSEAEFGLLLTKLRDEVSEAYRGPGRVLACHTVLFQATKMVDGRARSISPDLGWARVLEPRLSAMRSRY